MTPEQKALDRFRADTADHTLTVLHDDGLYRHLRFAASGMFYWFEIVTWPGHLTIAGDVETYTFSRSRDMLEFFEASCGRINPPYWAQKLHGPGGGRALARRYSHDALRDRVMEWARDEAADYQLGTDEHVPYLQLLADALEREVLYGHTHDDREGHERLELLEEAVGYMDCWEWDLREYDWSFLWCCWAIVWGIEQYRAATREAMAA